VATQETQRLAAKEALKAICPSEMWEGFEALVEMGLSSLTPEQCEKVASDINSTRSENGVDLTRLLEVGKGYGVTPEMVQQFQNGSGSSTTDSQ
jgi:hypothetical protein